MTKQSTHREEASMPHGSIISYTLGFIFSIILTLAAFSVTSYTSSFIVPIICGLALLQLLVQLFFFLHLGSKGAPASHQYLFAFTLLIIGILIGGTLWIMTNLERLHMNMTGNTMDELYTHGVVAPENELK